MQFLFLSYFIVKVNITYFTKVIHLKQLSCKWMSKVHIGKKGVLFFSWSILYLPHHYWGHLQHFLWSSITSSYGIYFQCRFFKQPNFLSSLHPDSWFLFFQPLFYSMAAPCDILLTSSNYFSWKYRMEDVLWSRGIFIITSQKET